MAVLVLKKVRWTCLMCMVIGTCWGVIRNETRLRADTCMLMVHGLKYGISVNCRLKNRYYPFEPNYMHTYCVHWAASYICTLKQNTSCCIYTFYLAEVKTVMICLRLYQAEVGDTAFVCVYDFREAETAVCHWHAKGLKTSTKHTTRNTKNTEATSSQVRLSWDTFFFFYYSSQLSQAQQEKSSRL